MTRCCAPDGSVTVLIVNDIPATVVDGNRGFARLTADARTGTGPPGTAFARAAARAAPTP